jgi:hypothetical protein
MPTAGPSPDTPLRLQVSTNRAEAVGYSRSEWVVLRLTASAPCLAAVYRVGTSGSVTQIMLPEEKPAGSYGLAVKAGEDGLGREWVIAVTSLRRLSAAETAALLRSQPELVAEGEALNALLLYLESRKGPEEPALALEPWQSAVAVVGYAVVDRAAVGEKGPDADAGDAKRSGVRPPPPQDDPR